MDDNGIEATLPLLAGAATLQFSPQPTRIEFYAGDVWALRITRDRVEGNPDVPADDAAKAILAAMDSQIKALR